MTTVSRDKALVFVDRNRLGFLDVFAMAVRGTSNIVSGRQINLGFFEALNSYLSISVEEKKLCSLPGELITQDAYKAAPPVLVGQAKLNAEFFGVDHIEEKNGDKFQIGDLALSKKEGDTSVYGVLGPVYDPSNLLALKIGAMNLSLDTISFTFLNPKSKYEKIGVFKLTGEGV